jgi:hypothetical protein
LLKLTTSQTALTFRSISAKGLSFRQTKEVLLEKAIVTLLQIAEGHSKLAAWASDEPDEAS